MPSAFMAESSHVSSVNPWATQDSLLGMRLGDPQSGLALARRHGLLGITPVSLSCHGEVGMWTTT